MAAEMPVTSPTCAHWTPGSNEPVTRIVIHDEEYPVSPTSAEAVAAYFATPAAGGSAHYIVDANSTLHPLAESVIAWHAPPNQGSIGVEHDGYAVFSAGEWASGGSLATFSRSAALVAGICTRRGIPPVFLSAATLAANPSARGITTHAEVSAAFHQSDHTDPGPHFPMSDYLASVKRLIAERSTGLVPAWYIRMLAYTPGCPYLAGSDVAHVQRAVGAASDGFYGPATASAVQAWQRAHHLQADGIVGPQTAATIS